MRIDQRLYQETRFQDIPPEDRRNKWQRLDCPYCGHKRAVISYEINWFQCWACGVKRTGYTDDSQALAVVRFARQLDKAAKKVKADFGYWLNSEDVDDLENVARWYVWNYTEGEKGTGYDAGMLAIWEVDCNADEEPWRLEGKVQSVLDRDLMNWAAKLKRWKEQNQVAGAMGPSEGEPTDGDDQGGEAKAIPGLVTDGIGYGLLKREASFAAKYGFSPRGKYFGSKEPPGTKLLGLMRYDELKRCDLMRNGVGPIAGHCRWCDKALGRPASCPPGDINVTAEEHDYLHEFFPLLAAIRLDGYTEGELAEQKSVSVRTIKRRVAGEKHALERSAYMLAE